jgi:hypothetical protein
MLIDRQRLIETIQASPSRDRFECLLSVLQQHQFKDLLLANVLLEAQSFEVLPLALHSAVEEDRLSPSTQKQAMLSWVILSQPEVSAEIDPLLFFSENHDETTARATLVIDQLLDKECIKVENVLYKKERDTSKLKNLFHISKEITRKITFYKFCKKLDSAIDAVSR